MENKQQFSNWKQKIENVKIKKKNRLFKNYRIKYI